MTVTITMGGHIVTDFHWMDINIDDVFAPTGDVLTVKKFYRVGRDVLPYPAELITVLYSDDQGHSTNFFSGPLVEMSFEHNLADNFLTLEAKDLTFRLDSKLVAGIFTQLTVEEMVKAILDTHAPNFTYTELQAAIDAGDTSAIIPKTFDWQKVSEALQAIAEERRYVWWVTFDGEVKFKKAELLANPAPITFIQPSTNLDIGGFRFTTSINELKNVIYIREFFFKSQNEVFEPGDNAVPTSNFTDISGQPSMQVHQMQYQPYDLSSITVEVNEASGGWVVYNVVDDHASRTPGSGTLLAETAYVDKLNRTVKLARSTTPDDAFPANTLLRIRYTPLLEPAIPELIIDTSSVLHFSELESNAPANNGEHQFMMSFGSLEFSGQNPITNLMDYARSIMEKYNWPIVTGSFTAFWDGENGTGVFGDEGWKAGQVFQLFEPNWYLMDWSAFYQTGLQTAVTCYVQNVRTTFVNNNVIKWEISFSSVLGGQ